MAKNPLPKGTEGGVLDTAVLRKMANRPDLGRFAQVLPIAARQSGRRVRTSLRG